MMEKVITKKVRPLYCFYNLTNTGLKMKLTVFLLVVLLFKLQASAYLENTTLALNIESASELSDDIDYINSNGLLFLAKIDGYIAINNETLTPPPSKYRTSQERAVKGVITDKNNIPIPGANILLKGTSTGVTSDFDGKYNIKVPNEAAILQFSFVGYQTKEIVVGNREIINITLDEDTETLDEIVVTALGIKKETKALGYSLTQVDGEELSTIKQPNAINSLQGKVAGVNVTQNATGASGSSRVIIRGASSLNGDNQPLYVIDGIPVSNVNNGSAGIWGGSDGGDGISSLNADDIESVGVLKGGAASALYGSRASNGVIIVTTKSGKGQQGLGIELSSSATFENVDTSLQNYQTEYGHGRFGAKPANTAEALEIGLSSWGARLDGSSVAQWDGESRPYSYVGSNIDYFYRQATTFINTIAITGAGDNMNYRFSASNLSNDDIIPNSGLDRKSFSLNAPKPVFCCL